MTALLQRLREVAGRRRRVRLDQVWAAFRDVEPVLAASTRQREHLRVALGRLAEGDEIQLPKSRGLWERSATPELPAWIQLPRSPEAERPDIDGVAWAPELEFARDVRRGDQLEALLAVQRFLATGGRERPLVPARERSVAVFGDEKAIDRFAKTSLFAPDRLTFELLRAFPVSPPMVIETFRGAASSMALLVENHHTYHSLVRWNREEREYRLVGYGAGKAAWSSVTSLREIVHELEVERIEYFGDLDREGVRIAAKLALAARRATLPPVVPAIRWYELLLDRADAVPDLRDDGRSLEARDLDWFPEPTRAQVQGLLDDGSRLPQELVGWDVLSSTRR